MNISDLSPEVRIRYETAQRHLIDEDVTEVVTSNHVCVNFGPDLRVHLEGEKFWIGESPAGSGRQFPRLLAFKRACLFIEAAQVTEKR